jgi:hypothetical protein
VFASDAHSKCEKETAMTKKAKKMAKAEAEALTDYALAILVENGLIVEVKKDTFAVTEKGRMTDPSSLEDLLNAPETTMQ